MTWFRSSSLVFLFWAVVFGVFPRFANEFAGVGYDSSPHAEDWTRLVGLFALAFAVLLNEAHRSASGAVRRSIAVGVLVFTIPCAALMTYWQIVPDRHWFRLDILNILLLIVISYGLYSRPEVFGRVR